jgi:farnesyl diphosphate synthase
LFQAVFQEYKNESYKKLIADIEAQPSIMVQNVLKCLHKIYKRQK